jgi:hypothetical protein
MKLNQRTLIIGGAVVAGLVVVALQLTEPVYVVLVLAVLALVGLVAWSRVRGQAIADEEADWEAADEWGLASDDPDDEVIDLDDRLAGFLADDRPSTRLFADDRSDRYEETYDDTYTADTYDEQYVEGDETWQGDGAWGAEREPAGDAFGGATYADDRYTDDRYTDDRYAADRYADDRPTDDRYAADRYADDRYVEEAPTDDRYAADRYADDRYVEEAPAGDRYAADRYTDDRYVEEAPADDRYTEARYTDDRYAGDRYVEEAPADDRYTDDRYAGDRYAEEAPAEDRYTDDRYAGDRYAEEAPAEPAAADYGADYSSGYGDTALPYAKDDEHDRPSLDDLLARRRPDRAPSDGARYDSSYDNTYDTSHETDTLDEEYAELVGEYAAEDRTEAPAPELVDDYEPPAAARKPSIFAAPGIIDEARVTDDDAILEASRASRVKYDDVLAREDANAETREILSRVASLLAKYE